MKHVVVLCGGRSAEHDISFLSASSVLQNLDTTKYELSVLGIQRDGSTCSPDTTAAKLKLQDFPHIRFPSVERWVCALSTLDPPADVVFPVLHGPYGEDGTVQGVLESLDVPYVGSGVWGSAVSLNKIHSKKILGESGLPVLPCIATSRTRWQDQAEAFLQEVENQLSYPVFVKPANLGSSVGVNKSKDRENLLSHVEVAFGYDDYILVEQGIKAREIEVSVLGNERPEASLAGEIIPSEEFYSYQAKYLDQESQLLVPAPLSKTQMREVQRLALAVFSSLQVEGMARVDFLMEKETSAWWVSELNTIPGFTRISMYPKLWEASGLSYTRLLDKMIDLGLERHRRRRRLSVGN